MGRAKEEGILAEEHLQSLLGNRQMIIERIYEAQFRPKHLRRLPVHISDEEKAKLEELYNEGWWDPHMDTQPAHLEGIAEELDTDFTYEENYSKGERIEI